jgi:hypothetical protein
MSAHHVNVVLVHGAWADGSSWSKVIGPLKAAGHLRTRPVDHTPMVTAPADVADIILDAARDVAATS